MTKIKLGDDTVNTNGMLPNIGSRMPDATLVGLDLKEVKLKSFAGKNIILNIFPSVDTSVCATSVRQFNQKAASQPDTVVLCISKDLPFALKRFCGAEGIDKVISVSDFRNQGFSSAYGVVMVDGALEGLFARAVVVVGKDGLVKHTELVSNILHEPDYDKAISAI